MKKSFVRMLMLSCLAIASIAPVQAQTSSQTKQQEDATAAAMASMSSIGAANASAAYTGNSAMAAQTAQPGQVMMPAGMQYGQPMYMVPGSPMVPGFGEKEEPERPVTMRYNKKDQGGFYGAALPTRLFNNVPSDW